MPSYRVKISTSIGSSLSGRTEYALFPNCKVNEKGDKFSFKSSCIIIECKRSHGQKKEEIENNPRNTIRIQILRALLLYYAANVQSARIYSISVTQVSRNENKEVVLLQYTKHNQPLSLRTIPVGCLFDINCLIMNVLSDGSHPYETLLSHWLGACSVSDRYEVFARLWRCIERLSIKAYHGAAHSEKERLKALRSYIINHPRELMMSCDYVDTMTYQQFRSFSWKLLIYNNFPKTARVGTFTDYRDVFVYPYHDERVAKMLNDTLVYRDDELNSFGLYNDIITHLRGVLASHTKKNEDVVAILSAYFAYYIRNKIFHGEFSERSFSICKSDEDRIVDDLNRLMVKVSFELIQIYHLL